MGGNVFVDHMKPQNRGDNINNISAHQDFFPPLFGHDLDTLYLASGSAFRLKAMLQL